MNKLIDFPNCPSCGNEWDNKNITLASKYTECHKCDITFIYVKYLDRKRLYKEFITGGRTTDRFKVEWNEYGCGVEEPFNFKWFDVG